MRVNVINSDSLSSIDYLLFPEQNPNNQRYFYEQVNRFSETLTGIGKSFMETSRDIYNAINDSNAIKLAKAAIRAAKGVFHPNTIYECNNIDEVRSSQAIMQRYIMAQPEIRTYYHDQRCDGFSDTYVDMEPNKVGKDHYDYRRVMSGVVVDSTNDEGDDESWVTTYFEEARGDERDLEHTEKVMILKTWDIISMAISENQDPTNIFGGELG